jgi:hypothetical protein
MKDIFVTQNIYLIHLVTGFADKKLIICFPRV